MVSRSDASEVNARPTRSPDTSRPVRSAGVPAWPSRTGTKHVCLTEHSSHADVAKQQVAVRLTPHQQARGTGADRDHGRIWLVLTRPARRKEPGRPVRQIPAAVLIVLATAVGCVGGIYGIGGGAILAPVLIGSGRRAAEVAPAALASTFVTSAAGVITFSIPSIHGPGAVAPDWLVGVALGAGGLAGGYTGARLQSHLPDTRIRRLIGVLVIAIAAWYLASGLG
jgi:Sulfite exporter TauE/SafE